MTARDAIDVVEALEEAGITVWLDGGWAVDAVLGTQSRPHDDLDLVVELGQVDLLLGTLERRGYALGSGGSPKSFELVDRDGRQVDVHPVRFTPKGDGAYLMDNDEVWVYPAAGFAGEGHVLDRRVRCLTPEVQMLCHSGYRPHLASYDDVWTLNRRFGIPVPDEYHAPRETYAARIP